MSAPSSPRPSTAASASLVESVGPQPLDLVVERALYNNANGPFWAAGNDALGARLR